MWVRCTRLTLCCALRAVRRGGAAVEAHRRAGPCRDLSLSGEQATSAAEAEELGFAGRVFDAAARTNAIAPRRRARERKERVARSHTQPNVQSRVTLFRALSRTASSSIVELRDEQSRHSAQVDGRGLGQAGHAGVGECDHDATCVCIGACATTRPLSN